MKKAQPPLIAELSPTDNGNNTANKSHTAFAGTDNPRKLRAIHAVMATRPRRKEIDLYSLMVVELGTLSSLLTWMN